MAMREEVDEVRREKGEEVAVLKMEVQGLERRLGEMLEGDEVKEARRERKMVEEEKKLRAATEVEERKREEKAQ